MLLLLRGGPARGSSRAEARCVRSCTTFVSSHFRVDDTELEGYLQRKDLVVKVRRRAGRAAACLPHPRRRARRTTPASGPRRT